MAGPGDQKDRILDQFGRQAESYARLLDETRARAPSPILAGIAPQPDDIVLDVACGTGSLTLEVAPFVARAVGIDLTPAMLDQARAAQAQRGIGNVEWATGDVCQLPFADECFSLVMCRAAVHHFDRPCDVLAEMRRVGIAGSRIAIVDFAFEPEKGAAFDEIEKLRDPSHVHAPSLAELRALAEGLDLVETTVETLPRAELPFDAVLATSFPAECSVDDVRRLVCEDALSGQDRLGLQGRIVDGTLLVSYPMALVVWTRPSVRPGT